MESAKLLILDHDSETAEGISNLLSTSGIDVHVLQAQSLQILEKCLRESEPFLIIFGAGASNLATPEEIRDVTERYDIPVALQVESCNISLIPEMLKHAACALVPANRTEPLLRLIRQQLAHYQAMIRATCAEDELRDLREQHQLLLNNTEEAIAYLQEGLHVQANPAYLRFMGISDAASLTNRSLLDLVAGAEHDLRELFRQMGRGHYPAQAVPVKITPRGADAFPAVATFAPIRLRQENCVQVALRAAPATDASQEPTASPVAKQDPLTGLLTRDSFLPDLAAYLEDVELRAEASAVLFVEPDGFREQQELLGFAATDRLLRELARLITDCLEESDLVCRFSDPGFAVLLRRSDPAELDHVAHRILETCAEHRFVIDNRDLASSCSIGLVILGPMVTCAEQVIRHALEACAQAHAQGDGQLRHQPALSAVGEADSGHKWARRLRFALDNGNFYSLQQATVDLESGSSEYYEIHTFLREDEADIAQEEFLSAADDCQLGTEIDRALIPGILNTLATHDGGDRHIISISTNSLLDKSFPAWLEQQLTEMHIPGERLIIQLPAESVSANLGCARRILEELGPLGCSLSLAHFDDDNSHLRLLGTLDIELIKLSRDLVQKLASRKDARTKIAQLVSTAHHANVVVLAEGVQDATHMAILWQVGIRRIAGDFLQESSQTVAG